MKNENNESPTEIAVEVDIWIVVDNIPSSIE